jgi:hypothetical protein
MRFVALVPLTLFLASCGTFTEQPEDIGGSPYMHNVAKDAILEIAEPIDTRGAVVIFKKGRIQGWWNYDTWTYDCRLKFTSDPGEEVSEGRYRIVSAKYTTSTVPSDGDFNAINMFELSTIKGVPAEYMRCTKRGSFYDTGRQQTGPITVQDFKRTVGRYLTLVLKEDCDDPVNAHICSNQ